MKTTKRIISAVLCVLMISSVLPLTAFAAYENTYTNTGNQIEDLIAVATTQIGYTEGNSTSQQGGTSGGSGNYTKYGAWYGINPGAWCAMFVSWCANQAGISSTIIPKHASCDIGMQWFQNNGKWQKSKTLGGSYTPKRGDIIYFRTNTSITYDSTHVGIVTSCNGTNVYTIEGNASNKCQTKSYALTSVYILGYGTPAYTSGSTGGTSSGISGLGTYQVTATSLNMRNLPTTSGTTILQALPNGAQIDITQISNGWGYGTYNGKSGWISLSYATLIDPYYYITFDPNGGTVPADQFMVYAIKNNKQYNTIIHVIPTVTRTGYEFDGWYNSEYNYTLRLSDTFVVGKDITFKAQWSAKLGQYTITTNSDPLNIRDGAGSADTKVIGQIPKGTVVNITAIQGDWGFTTYKGVSGWVSMAYCTYYGAAPTEPAPVAKYTLTFDPNGGTMPSGYSTTYYFEAEQKLNDVIGGFPVPTRSGKEFDGWYWEKAGAGSGSFHWRGGWGTQPYYADFGNAKFVAHWVDHTHTYSSSVTKAATCQAAGVRTYTCTGCGNSYTEAIAQLSHKYSSQIAKAPTCSEVGIMFYTCSLCGASYEEDIAVTAHNYTYSNGKVACSSCTLGYNGWFNDIYYVTDGTCAKGVFKIGSDFYYSASDYKVAKNSTVMITSSEKNGLLTDCGDAYYTFDSNGKLVTTGFVTGGGNRYYYENTVLVKGLKKIENDYYYFDTNGIMVTDEWVTISGTIAGVPTASDSRYYFRPDGKLLAGTSVVDHIDTSNGIKYLYNINNEILTDGLYFFEGNYYYAYRDGRLATGVVYTYYNNNLLPRGYYEFDKNTHAMIRTGMFNHVDAEGNNSIYYVEDFVRAEGLRYINGNYYFFHYNSGEAVLEGTIYCGNPDIGAPFGYYKCEGYIATLISPTSVAAATADGVETGGTTFSARAESNTVISAETAATVIISALPVATDDEDDE